MGNAAIAVDLKFPSRDVDSLMRAMQRNAKDLNRPIEKSLQFAGWLVADSLRATTKIAKKTKEINEVTGKGKTRAGNKRYAVTKYDKNGRKSTFDVFAQGKREARKLKQVRIVNRGLAARSWHFAQKKLGSGRGGPKVSARAARLAARFGSAYFISKGKDAALKISNSLNYATSAFLTSGERTINNAMARAARRMVKMTEAAVAKKMGAK